MKAVWHETEDRYYYGEMYFYYFYFTLLGLSITLNSAMAKGSKYGKPVGKLMKFGLSMESGKGLGGRYLMDGLHSWLNGLMIRLIVECKNIKMVTNTRDILTKMESQKEKVIVLLIIIKYRDLQVG